MKQFLSLLLLSAFFISCNSDNVKVQVKLENEKAETTLNELKHVDWSKNATIYEANIRQFTPEGTFNAFEKTLPKLKELGIKIIWLMPVQPIGELNRKGSLGSYYSIKDYTAVNPEFGTMEDMRSLVNKAHDLGFKIILDWVANHSSWDNVWASEHPDWYTKDSLGNFIPPNPDWSDVLDLNYDNEELRAGMIDAMKFWIDEVGFDGFRCDVAYDVPLDFWNQARSELDKSKAVFMLAEADQTDHHEKAFDMSYAWELMHLTKHVVNGDSALVSIDRYMKRQSDRFSSNDYRMNLLTSHDENSWNGTIEERYGKSEEAVAALIFTLNGMPLIYSGQEYGNTKALAFFEKDNPIYSNPEIFTFYQTLIALNNENQALWNGNYGGDFTKINTSKDEAIYAFKRNKGENTVLTIVNLTDEEQNFSLIEDTQYSLQNVFTGDEVELNNKSELSLSAYGYLVLKK